MKKKYRERAKSKIKVETKRVRMTRAMPHLAASAAKSLQMLSDVLGQLFSDENFVTLLEAESLTAIPAILRPVFEEARNGYEIHQGR
jgi:hypothetical protein